MRYRKHAHCVFGLRYHIVLVTKYRRKVFDDEMREYLKQEVIRLLQDMDGEAIEIETDQDHVHILADLPPNKPITEIIRVLKTVTARKIRKNYRDRISDKLRGDSLWSDSYFIATTGGVTIDVLKHYIERQGNPRKRGRPKKSEFIPA